MFFALSFLPLSHGTEQLVRDHLLDERTVFFSKRYIYRFPSKIKQVTRWLALLLTLLVGKSLRRSESSHPSTIHHDLGTFFSYPDRGILAKGRALSLEETCVVIYKCGWPHWTYSSFVAYQWNTSSASTLSWFRRTVFSASRNVISSPCFMMWSCHDNSISSSKISWFCRSEFTLSLADGKFGDGVPDICTSRALGYNRTVITVVRLLR